MEIMNIETAKSYATRANLEKGLAKFPANWRYLVVNNAAGRFTAVFQGQSMDSDIAGAAREGFMTI